MRTRLLLVRHGETFDNRQGIFQGQSGEGITPFGREQATRLGERLKATGARFDALYTSDLQRARETADLLAGSIGGHVPEPDAGLREVYLGAWEGHRPAEIQERFPDEWAAWRGGEDIARGGGERLSEVSARMASSIERIAERHAGGAVVIVSHGAAIKCLTAHVLATTTLRLRPLRPIANTGVTLFERAPDGAMSLLVYNDTTHLEDALARILHEDSA